MKNIFIADSAIHIPISRKHGHVVADGSMGDMAVCVGRKILEKYPEEMKHEISHVVVACVGLVGEVFESMASRIQHELKLDSRVSVIQMVGGCSVSLSAFDVAARLLSGSPSQYAILITCDSISRLVNEKTYVQRPSSARWGDGAAALLLSNKRHGKIRIGEFHSMTDGASWEQCRIINQSGRLEFDFLEAPVDFKKYDLMMASETIKGCLKKNDTDISEISGLILLNRSNGFGAKLRDSIGSSSMELYQSFDEIGHLGGTDLLVNIHNVITSPQMSSGRYLVYSCGYGYTWGSGLIQIGA